MVFELTLAVRVIEINSDGIKNDREHWSFLFSRPGLHKKESLLLVKKFSAVGQSRVLGSSDSVKKVAKKNCEPFWTAELAE